MRLFTGKACEPWSICVLLPDEGSRFRGIFIPQDTNHYLQVVLRAR